MGARETIQCWGYGKDHLLKNCPHRKENPRNIHNIEEATTSDDVARTISKIYNALEYHQANHESTMV